MKLKNILLSGILVGSLALGSCTKFSDEPKNYELINLSEMTLGQGYERPGGLSNGNIIQGTQKSFNIQSQVTLVNGVITHCE